MYGWIAMRAGLAKAGPERHQQLADRRLADMEPVRFRAKGSPNAANAEAVINAMLSKEYGQKLTEVTNYPSTSAEVAAQFSAEDKRNWASIWSIVASNFMDSNFRPISTNGVESWNIV